jgi:antirestriction protein ArdC
MLPLFETCRGADRYYATLAHETTHWTAHESRLARDFGTTRSGGKATQSKNRVHRQPADVLKADNRAIFTAASHAQRAADFINGLQPAASAG